MNRSELIDSLFESIFKHATMGIIVTNQRGYIILANEFAEKNFGYQRNELEEKAIEDLIPKRFHRKHKVERNDYYGHAETRAMGAGRDLYGLRKDGSEFPVEVSLSPVHTEEGIFVIAFIIDITVRKEKEKAEVRYQEKIDQILSSLTKEKELNDLKTRFVSMASHEFRTPLSTILSSAALIDKYTEAADQPKREKHTNRITASVKTLTNILDEFLSIGKMEEGRTEVRYSRFNLVEVISAVVNEMKDVRKRGQKVNYEHDGSEMVYLDADFIKSIMINLLSNALKFCEEEDEIQLKSKVDADKVVIEIKDNGPGIPLDDQKHLYERFFRGNNVLNIQGTGLGLYIVAKYVELMNGSVSFKSDLGIGTSFKLLFKL